MAALVRAFEPNRLERSKWPFLLAGGGLAVLCVFLLLPGSIASKTHLALHGICAQRASHSLSMGGQPLPLDARMTGIYIGGAVTGLWLLAAGNLRCTRLPPRRVLAMLGLFVFLLAVDGFNALAFDLGLWSPYAPSNVLRLATGILGGTALGVALIYLVAATIWARGDRSRSVVGRLSVLVVPLGMAFALGGLALSGLPILYAPFAIGLLLAALGVFATLATLALALVLNRGWTFGSLSEIGGIACAGAVVAIGVMAALAGVRLVLETWFGLVKLT